MSGAEDPLADGDFASFRAARDRFFAGLRHETTDETGRSPTSAPAPQSSSRPTKDPPEADPDY